MKSCINTELIRTLTSYASAYLGIVVRTGSARYQTLQWGRRILVYCATVKAVNAVKGWLRSTVVERRSVAGELSLSYARPAADGW